MKDNNRRKRLDMFLTFLACFSVLIPLVMVVIKTSCYEKFIIVIVENCIGKIPILADTSNCLKGMIVSIGLLFFQVIVFLCVGWKSFSQFCYTRKGICVVVLFVISVTFFLVCFCSMEWMTAYREMHRYVYNDDMKMHRYVYNDDMMFYLILMGAVAIYILYEVFHFYWNYQKSKENPDGKNHIRLSANSINFDFTANNVLPQKVAIKVCSLLPVKPRRVDEWDLYYKPENFDFSILRMENNNLVILPKPQKHDSSIVLYIKNGACDDEATLKIKIKGNSDLDEDKYYEY